MDENTKISLPSIEAAIKGLRAALNEEVLRFEQTFKANSGDIISKVAERKAFAKRLALDRKITEIWEEIRYYPSLHRLCEIDNPQMDKREKEFELTFMLKECLIYSPLVMC